MIKGNESLVSNIQFRVFNIIYMLMSNPTFWSIPYYNLVLKRHEQFFEFQNNVKHRNMSSDLAYNSKSILATSDSVPLIMSHMAEHFYILCLQSVCTTSKSWHGYYIPDRLHYESLAGKGKEHLHIFLIFFKCLKVCSEHLDSLNNRAILISE